MSQSVDREGGRKERQDKGLKEAVTEEGQSKNAVVKHNVIEISKLRNNSKEISIEKNNVQNSTEIEKDV